jgi:LEA14-like dessication related protein
MIRLPLLFIPVLLTLFLGGCATMDPNYEQPKVDVVGITKSETDTAALQFTIQLRILNPNAETIRLDGLYYELSLDGIEVVTGTANNLPPIEGYSDTVVSVRSAASLVNSVRLAARLMEATGGEIPYELRAKLGTSSRWMPATTVTETGMIPLR